jgi:hypothetical protein
LLKEPALVNLETREPAIACNYKLTNGMPCCALFDLFKLPDLSGMNEINCAVVMNTENVQVGLLDLLHVRTCHTSKGKLVEKEQARSFFRKWINEVALLQIGNAEVQATRLQHLQQSQNNQSHF